MVDLGRWGDNIIDWVTDYVPKIVGALLIWFIGLCLINCVINYVKKQLKSRNIDSTLSVFLLNLLAWVLKIILFFTIIDKIGVEITSMASIIAGLALAVGFAL